MFLDKLIGNRKIHARSQRTGKSTVFLEIEVLESRTMPAPVSFPREAYAQLGQVTEAVRGGFEEIRLEQSGSQAAINYGSVALSTVSTIGDLVPAQTQIGNAVTSAASAASALLTVNNAVNPQSLSTIVAALSSINAGPLSSSLSNAGQSLATLNGQSAEPILPPTFLVYYAAAISPSARGDISKTLEQAIAGRASLVNALNSIGRAHEQLANLANQLTIDYRVDLKLQEKLFEIANQIPLGPKILESAIINAVLMESTLLDLQNRVSRLRGQLDPVAAQLNDRLFEFDDLIAGLRAALAQPVLASSWTTSADVGGANAFFGLSFTGTSFGVSGTEISGQFLLGTLTVTNFITLGVGDTALSANISFHVTRVVNDPILGPQTTTASVSMPMTYFATLNDPEDNCGVSRDYFFVPALGVNLFICETESRGFAVYGQYDSPLRIVGIQALPSSHDDPDPAVVNEKYLLDVIGGTGSGVFAFNQTVVATPSVPVGRRFVSWESDSTLPVDLKKQTITFSMPAKPVTLKAVFEPLRATHVLVVDGGLGSGTFATGTEVPITATVPTGFGFSRWAGDVGDVKNVTSSTTFVLLNHDARIYPILVPVAVVDFKVDTDGDGVPDKFDVCPNSIRTPTVILGGTTNTGVTNRMIGSGSTLADELAKLLKNAKNYGQYRSAVVALTRDLENLGLLTRDERDLINSKTLAAYGKGPK